MALKNLFDMVKADRYTADGREEIIKAQEAETEDATRRTYQIGEISQSTGLQKTANGWVKPKSGKQPGKTNKPNPNGVVAQQKQKLEAEKYEAARRDAQAPSKKTEVNTPGLRKDVQEAIKRSSPEEIKAYIKELRTPGSRMSRYFDNPDLLANVYEDELNKMTSWGTPSEPSENVKHLKDPNPGIPSQGNDIAINGKAYKAHLGDTILTKSGQKYEYAGKTSTGKIRVTSREGSTPITTAIDEKEILGLSEPENMSPKEKAALRTAENNTESKPAAQEVKLGGGADTYYFEDPDNMSNEDKVFKSLGIELAETFGDHDGEPGNTETWANGWLDNIMDNGGLGIKSKKTRQPAAPVPADEVMRIVEENPARWDRIIGNAKKFYEGKGRSTDFESDEFYPIKLVGGKTKPSAQYYAEGKRNEKNNPLTGKYVTQRQNTSKDSAPRVLTGDCRIRIRKEKPALTGDTKIRVRK